MDAVRTVCLSLHESPAALRIVGMEHEFDPAESATAEAVLDQPTESTSHPQLNGHADGHMPRVAARPSWLDQEAEASGDELPPAYQPPISGSYITTFAEAGRHRPLPFPDTDDS